MQSISTYIFSPDICNAIFYTLLHSLWQIPAIALCIKLLARTKYKNPISNYNANLSAIIVSIVAAGFTLSFYLLRGSGIVYKSIGGGVVTFPQSGLGIDHITYDVISNHSMSWTEWLTQYDIYIVLFWALGVAILSGRIIAGWIGLRYLKKDLSFQIPPHIQSKFIEIKKQLGINDAVRLAFSTMSTVPMVIGHLKPIVLIPFATINQLSNEEVEAIIAHELAHILHFDYLKNLIVMIGEALFFYHPVIWMLTAEIKEDRELVCDDTVMKLYPYPIQYAKTLVKLEELYQGNQPNLSLALFTNKFKLMKRVKRILNMQHDSNNGKAKLIIMGLLFCSLVIFSSADLLINNTKNVDVQKEKIVNKSIKKSIENDEIVKTHSDILESPNLNKSHSNKEAVRINQPTLSRTLMQNSFDSKMNATLQDTLDDEERVQIRKEIKERKKKLKKKTKARKEEMRISRQKINAEYKDDLQQQRKELKKLKKKLGKSDNSFHFDGDFDFNEEDIEEWAENLSEWGERLGEEISASFDDDWRADMEEWGEEFGARFSEKFYDKYGDEFGEEFADKWQDKMSRWGEEFSDTFDEEWIEDIAEMGAELGAAVTESMDEEWLTDISDMSMNLARAMKNEIENIDEDDVNYNLTFGDVEDKQTKQKLVDALNLDGLLKNTKNVILITDDIMSVNGVKQSSIFLKNYQDLIKKGNSKAFNNGKTEVSFVVHGTSLEDSKRTRLSIQVEN